VLASVLHTRTLTPAPDDEQACRLALVLPLLLKESDHAGRRGGARLDRPRTSRGRHRSVAEGVVCLAGAGRDRFAPWLLHKPPASPLDQF